MHADKARGRFANALLRGNPLVTLSEVEGPPPARRELRERCGGYDLFVKEFPVLLVG